MREFKLIDNSDFNHVPHSGDNPAEISQNMLLYFFKDKHNTDYFFYESNEMLNFPFFHSFTKGDEFYNTLNNLFNNNDITLTVLYGGFDEDLYNSMNNVYPSNIKFIYWGTAWLHYIKYFIESSLKINVKHVEIKKDYNKLFIFLNNRPKQHRRKLLDELYKNGLLENNIFSWNELSTLNGEVNDFKYWNEKIVRFDQGTYQDFIFNPKILETGALINLVGETNVNRVFITEKTYKPLILGTPFICLGSINQNSILKKLGFELYDEIFNYEFDSDQNLDNRILGIVQNLDNLSKLPIQKIHDLIKEKVEYNRNRSIEICSKDPFIPYQLIDLYRNYKNVFINKLHYRIPFIEEMFRYF